MNSHELCQYLWIGETMLMMLLGLNLCLLSSGYLMHALRFLKSQKFLQLKGTVSEPCVSYIMFSLEINFFLECDLYEIKTARLLHDDWYIFAAMVDNFMWWMVVIYIYCIFQIRRSAYSVDRYQEWFAHEMGFKYSLLWSSGALINVAKLIRWVS